MVEVEELADVGVVMMRNIERGHQTLYKVGDDERTAIANSQDSTPLDVESIMPDMLRYDQHLGSNSNSQVRGVALDHLGHGLLRAACNVNVLEATG